MLSCISIPQHNAVPKPRVIIINVEKGSRQTWHTVLYTCCLKLHTHAQTLHTNFHLESLPEHTRTIMVTSNPRKSWENRVGSYFLRRTWALIWYWEIRLNSSRSGSMTFSLVGILFIFMLNWSNCAWLKFILMKREKNHQWYLIWKEIQRLKTICFPKFKTSLYPSIFFFNFISW